MSIQCYVTPFSMHLLVKSNVGHNPVVNMLRFLCAISFVSFSCTS